MLRRTLVRPGLYQDSVTLMRVASELSALGGVSSASAVMATDANKNLLAEADLLTPEVEGASASDLVVVVETETDEALAVALDAATAILERQLEPALGRWEEPPARTLADALARQTDSNLLLVSTPGPHAGAEALKGLKAGLHVFVFSDNVPVEQEAELKEEARRRGLLVMGPDCGTAIISGVGLGFANAVASGPIGLVGPSGTGLQVVTVLADRLGLGISQAIGCGSRDHSETVGGVTTRQGLEVLAADPATEVVVLVSKPPAPRVAEEILAACGGLGKPAVVNFLGLDSAALEVPADVTLTRTLEDTARLAVARVTGAEPPRHEFDDATLRALNAARGSLDPEQRFVRGLFSGGTLCVEALVVLNDAGVDVHSNVPLTSELHLLDVTRSRDHTCVDLGADEFTVGRPHPMIDYRVRIERLLHEARDPTVAVILLDVVLGYGAHPDPAGELGPAIREARRHAASDGRQLIVITSVCGTERDPQELRRQEQELRDAGSIVLVSNAQAARATTSALGTKAGVR